MGLTLDFDVRGTPVPQGSSRAFVVQGKAILVTGAGKGPLAAWRHAIATEARRTVEDHPPLTGPVTVALAFRFPRPKSHWLPANARRPAAELRLDAPVFVTSKPDADKLARAALDALTGVVFGDDAQVSTLSVVKRYAGLVEGPGVHVTVRSNEVTR
jgi:crossover junction endodeoxyribonuclease RusA